MRKTYRHLVLFALVSLIASLGMTTSQTEPSRAQTVSRPNIVFILLDDMNVGDLKYMPNTQQVNQPLRCRTGLLPPQGFVVLARRWVVERTFSWISQNRRMSKDYKRLAATSEAFIYVAMTRLMVRRLASAQ